MIGMIWVRKYKTVQLVDMEKISHKTLKQYALYVYDAEFGCWQNGWKWNRG
jgi:hypothetical protein